jgi:predicted secreted protein
VNWVSGVLVYVVVWWLVLFCVLPFGIKPADEEHLGHQSGAPANPRLLFKGLLTTGIATALWVAIYLMVVSNLISFREP